MLISLVKARQSSFSYPPFQLILVLNHFNSNQNHFDFEPIGIFTFQNHFDSKWIQNLFDFQSIQNLLYFNSIQNHFDSYSIPKTFNYSVIQNIVCLFRIQNSRCVNIQFYAFLFTKFGLSKTRCVVGSHFGGPPRVFLLSNKNTADWWRSLSDKTYR